MIGWAEERLMRVYDTLHEIRLGHAVHSESYAVCSHAMDEIERLDDTIKDESDD